MNKRKIAKLVQDVKCGKQQEIVKRAKHDEKAGSSGPLTSWYRCSIQRFISDLKLLDLKDVHLDKIKKTPFRYFVEACLNDEAILEHFEKNDNCIRAIMKTFNKTSKEFYVRPKKLRLEKLDLKLIFGIVDGDEAIPLAFNVYEHTEFLSYCFPKKNESNAQSYRLSRRRIYEALAAMNSYIPWGYTALVHDLEKINKYDWSGHICAALVKSMTDCVGENADKCVLVLLYWICEHTNLVSPMGPEKFPRFLNWDLRQLATIILGTDVLFVGGDYVVIERLEITRQEMILLGIGHMQDSSMTTEGASVDSENETWTAPSERLTELGKTTSVAENMNAEQTVQLSVMKSLIEELDENNALLQFEIEGWKNEAELRKAEVQSALIEQGVLTSKIAAINVIVSDLRNKVRIKSNLVNLLESEKSSMEAEMGRLQNTI